MQKPFTRHIDEASSQFYRTFPCDLTWTDAFLGNVSVSVNQSLTELESITGLRCCPSALMSHCHPQYSAVKVILADNIGDSMGNSSQHCQRRLRQNRCNTGVYV